MTPGEKRFARPLHRIGSNSEMKFLRSSYRLLSIRMNRDRLAMNIFFDSAGDNSERFARGHTNLIARLVVFALLSVSILFVRPSWAGTAFQPCQLREYASLPVVLLNFEPPLVAVNINGRATHMWLDIGSAVSI